MEIIEWSSDPKNPLNNPCALVEIWDVAKNRVANDMCEYLIEHPGAAAVAANQVGNNSSFFVWVNEEQKLEVVINPAITAASDPQLMREGCLSFPGMEVQIERFNAVQVEYVTLNDEGGENISVLLKGMSAQIFQHEVDHLLGFTFLDYLDDDEYRRFIKKYQLSARSN